MSISELSTLFAQLLEHPDDEEVLAKLNDAAEGQSIEPDSPHAPQVAQQRSEAAGWANCIGEQRCYPQQIFHPSSLDELVAIIGQANKSGRCVRAVGSGHSFSNVCPTNDFLVDPHGMNAMLKLDPSTLRDPSVAKNLIAVESGITIADLNDALDLQGLALENMGSYDGQTLAGAISTGTHGTGISHGPIASSVRALTLVTSEGTLYQIEPSAGISDPEKFQSGPHPVVLKQDDAWFNTALVAMGCTGLIYSYVLHVVPAFYLQEFRTVNTWENLKKGLLEGASSSVLKSNYGYELDMNPYAIGNKHACIEIRHNPIAASKPSGTRGFRNWLAGVMSKWHWVTRLLVALLNHFPGHTPGTINTALNTLETPPKEKNGYIDKSFRVLNVGTTVAQVKAYSMELSIPCDANLVSNVDRLLAFMQSLTTAPKPIYLSGPLVLRFVAASSAFLAPQTGRTTCMIELDTLFGIHTAASLYTQVKEMMCKPGSGVRLHWGLDPQDSLSGQDIKDMYGESFNQWLTVYRQLNAKGLWNSPFTDRLGISQPRGN